MGQERPLHTHELLGQYESEDSRDKDSKRTWTRLGRKAFVGDLRWKKN